MNKIILSILIFVIAAFACYKLGINYSYSDVKDYLAFLGTISSMVFTIMGIWIALLYPEAIQKVVSSNENLKIVDFTESQLDSKRLESLVSSILVSGLVAILALLIFLLKILFFSTIFYKENLILIKSLALGLIVTITYLQGTAVFSVLFSNITFLNSIYEKRANRIIEKDL